MPRVPVRVSRGLEAGEADLAEAEVGRSSLSMRTSVFLAEPTPWRRHGCGHGRTGLTVVILGAAEAEATEGGRTSIVPPWASARRRTCRRCRCSAMACRCSPAAFGVLETVDHVFTVGRARGAQNHAALAEQAASTPLSVETAVLAGASVP